MAGGQTVDPGKLDAAGTAYEQVGVELGDEASRIETGVSSGQFGKAWSHAASPYADAIERYRDCVEAYGEKAADFGDRLCKAAKSYEDGEVVSRDMIASKQV
ncbi:type VII secretion target [Saccharomonospora xinjiangensis]|uniref:type VII secretion target n=1 Tax=Saccharomonospora xinjiangensis TaxID=75294 RepID=UPI00350EEA07